MCISLWQGPNVCYLEPTPSSGELAFLYLLFRTGLCGNLYSYGFVVCLCVCRHLQQVRQLQEEIFLRASSSLPLPPPSQDLRASSSLPLPPPSQDLRASSSLPLPPPPSFPQKDKVELQKCFSTWKIRHYGQAREVGVK